MLRIAIICSLIAYFAPQSLTAATVQGVIDTGELPDAKRASSRYQRGASEQPDPPPAPQAVVYLEGEFPQARWDTAPKMDELIQRGLQFEASVMPVPVGAEVAFPNEDETFHNVFSYSEAKTFDLGRYRKGDDPQKVVFDQPGEIAVFCEIHRHMRSTILVLDTPVFAVSDAEGAFTLTDVPVGNYELVVWYGPGKTSRQPVEVASADETLTVTPVAPN
ncbi:MAG: hypothetical protein ACQKBV_13015 [Puniceicoccales bacterium]